MPPEEKKADEKPVEELKIVGDGADPVEDEAAKPEEKKEAGKAELDALGEEDERVSHAEDEEEGPAGETQEQKRERRRKERHDRREKERRKSTELKFLRTRNEQLERRFSEVADRVDRQEDRAVAGQINNLKGQIAQAERIHAQAVTEHDGESATEALRIKSSLENDVRKLEGLQAETKQRKTSKSDEQEVDPNLMRNATAWTERNKAWFDPKLNDETSHFAKVLDDRMTREGEFDPRTPEYWEELDRRVQKHFPHIKKTVKMKSRDDWGDDDDAEDERPARRAERDDDDDEKTPEKKPQRKPGGPRFSVNGRERSIGANEVHIDAERRKAMEEAGVWEDPVLRQRYLKSYQTFDKDAASRKKNNY